MQKLATIFAFLALINLTESVYSEKLKLETSLIADGLRVIDYSAAQPMDIQYLAYEKFGSEN